MAQAPGRIGASVLPGQTPGRHVPNFVSSSSARHKHAHLQRTSCCSHVNRLCIFACDNSSHMPAPHTNHSSRSRRPLHGVQSSSNSKVLRTRGVARINSINSSSTSSSDRPMLESARSDVYAAGEAVDVVVIGAGIGGLSCAALLAYYGLKVLVCEAHSVAGGAAHCWSRRGCSFDSGTALFFGLRAQRHLSRAGTHTPQVPCTRSTHQALETRSGTHHAAGFNAAITEGARAAASVMAMEIQSCTSACQPGVCRSEAEVAGAAADTITAAGAAAVRRDNPLSAVLQILEEEIDVIPYAADRTSLVFPQGIFRAQIGSQLFPAVVAQLWGQQAEQEWVQLQELCRDLASAASAIHPVVVRYDPCVALTAALRRPGRFLRYLSSQPALMKPDVMFSQLVGSVVSSPGLQAFMDVLCKGTSGAPAASIPAAYMVRAFAEMYQPDTQLQWPRGGPQALVEALVRGLRKHGGKLLLNTAAECVLPGSRGAARGVKLRTGAQVTARRAVVSNASLWDTLKLVPAAAVLPEFLQQLEMLQAGDSFVHLHAVVDWPPFGSTGSTPISQLPVHSYFLAPDLVNDTGWPTLTISTAVDDTLAPPGKQILHAYMAEPFAEWEGLHRNDAAYLSNKAQRAEVLWGLVEQVLPGARAQLDWQMLATPLTHQRFRRRHAGTYGVKAPLTPFGSCTTGAAMQPKAVLVMKQLYCCGDTTFPYVGTPAAAASGMWVANSLAPVSRHWKAANIVDCA